MPGTANLALHNWSATVEMGTEVGRLGYSRMDNPGPSPQVQRRRRVLKRLPLFLSVDLWKELSYAASFATRVFQLTGSPETVSRNGWIEDALIWALAAYWKDKGGKPSSTTEFERRAAQAATKLKAAEADADEEADS